MDTVAGTSNGIGRKLLWVLIAILGAVSLGIVALSRGETISAAWLVIAAVCVYAARLPLLRAFHRRPRSGRRSIPADAGLPSQ